MRGRTREPLDTQGMFFLSTFTEEGDGVRAYSIDVEKAADSHYEFTAEAMDSFDAHLTTRYTGGTMAERLTQFVAGFPSTHAAEAEIRASVSRLGLEVKQYHFD